MKVAKRFRWEGAHRLPWHTGGCQNLHGHSYQMWVELKGEADGQGMLIDFKDIKKVLSPLINAWDHAVLVADSDHELLQAISILKSKHFILPFDTTSENLCEFIVNFLAAQALDLLEQHKVSSINVRLQETETCYAEHEVTVLALRLKKKEFENPEVVKS
ncbi:6-pyruvoyl trahydropterin synthase family protein [Spirosoma spitsbergense]|uniref:6-pyruvoyl trahydropterin synthase family protein n=1 Tax=Spirosoma spitsbergense TaxID=431554 RepID=UPI0007C6A06B|nr:6-carboxytetrahydropterin synthase [Spirosoma spitsbergense]